MRKPQKYFVLQLQSGVEEFRVDFRDLILLFGSKTRRILFWDILVLVDFLPGRLLFWLSKEALTVF